MITSQKSIGIMGTPWSSGNRGVQALAESVAGLLAQSDSNTQLFFIGSSRSTDPVRVRLPRGEVQIPTIPWRLSPWKGIRSNLLYIFIFALLYRMARNSYVRDQLARACPFIRKVRRLANVGDIRGGDSFSDIYGARRFLIGSMAVISVIWINGAVVMLPQTYGPFRSRLCRLVARYILANSSRIVARDVHSRMYCQKLVSFKKDIEISPDVAFSLVPLKPKQDLSGLFSRECGGILVGLNINGLLYNGGYTRLNQFGLQLEYREYIKDLVDQLLKIPSVRIILVPHTYAQKSDVESDNEANRVLHDSIDACLRERVRVIDMELDCHELKHCVGNLDFFIGSRMHACIAAISQAIPCAGVAYSMKFQGVFETVSCGASVIDARSTSTVKAVEATLRLFHDRSSIQKILEKNVPSVLASLQSTFGKI